MEYSLHRIKREEGIFYYGENLFNLEKRKNLKKLKGFKFVIVFVIVAFIYHLSYNKNIKGVGYDDERY